MIYEVSAKVVAWIEAESKKEALNKFEAECPYNVIGYKCEEEGEEEDETDPFRKEYGFDF